MRVLCVNPGSTSTKIAVFDDETLVCAETVRHAASDLAALGHVADQAPLRRRVIVDALAAAGVELGTLDAVVGRGGLTRPVRGGTYVVDADLLAELRSGASGEHASNLGAILADELARAASRDGIWVANGPVFRDLDHPDQPHRDVDHPDPVGGVPAFVVDPVVVDELDAVARFSGHPEIERRSIFHALNSKAVARRYAASVGRPYEELNLIVVHLGGGISVSAHRGGRVVDVNNALDGDGPFAPERAGGLPTASWVKLILERGLTASETSRLLVGGGGLASLVGSSDVRQIEEQATGGAPGSDAMASDVPRLRLVLDALAYQVAKEIGACAAVLRGRVDAVLLTGGLAHDDTIVDAIKRRVAFIAEVVVFPGEDELAALRDGALRVLRGDETPRTFAEGVVR